MTEQDKQPLPDRIWINADSDVWVRTPIDSQDVSYLREIAVEQPPETEQRIAAIRKRCGTVWVGLMQEDVEFLLSLLDGKG